jgi:transcriptional regulator
MYIPKDNQFTDNEQVIEFLKQNAFGLLVSTVQGQLWATHIPLEFEVNERGQQVLFGHVAKANPQWRDLVDGSEVMAVFSGPHAYVSSSWYDHENVPTWNYIAVHVYGRYRQIEGDKLLDSLTRLTNKYEASSVNPVRVEEFSESFMKSHLRALVGFEIEITDIQAKKKLSQNRDDTNYDNITAELDKRGDAQSLAVAEAMRELR